jgi:hypothetical protein
MILAQSFFIYRLLIVNNNIKVHDFVRPLGQQMLKPWSKKEKKKPKYNDDLYAWKKEKGIE